MTKPYFEAAFDVISDEVCIVSDERRIIKTNRFINNKYGKSGGYFRGRKCYKEFFGRDEPCDHCPFEESIDTLQTVSKEILDDYILTVSPVFNGNPNVPIGFVHIIKDISKIKKIQQRLNSIIEALPDLTFIVDEDGKYCEIYGRENEHNLIKPINELHNNYFKDVLPKDKVTILMKGLNKTLDSNKSQVFRYCLPIRGKTCYFQARTSPLPELINGKRAIIWVAIDVNEVVKKEKELLKLKKVLDDKQKELNS